MTKALSLKSKEGCVVELATEMYQQQQKRFVKNVMLKCYDAFIVQMSQAVTGFMQGRLSVLSDDEIVALFNLSQMKSKMLDKEKRLTEAVDNTLEFKLMESIAKFK
jgi:hypothetical protein